MADHTGLYKIYNEDCLEGKNGVPTWQPNTFDLALIDPPYFDYKTSHRKDKADKLSQHFAQQSQEDQMLVVRKCIDLLKPDSAFFLFTSWENIAWMHTRLGTLVRNCIIWDKQNWTAGDLKGSFGNQYEVILMGCKGNWKFKDKRLSDLWSLPRVGTNRIHPTQKPIALYDQIILNSTDESAWVIDPYLGSGASVISALKNNRNIVGYEIDEEFYKRVLERVERWKKGGDDA